MNKSIEWCCLKETSLLKKPYSCHNFDIASSVKAVASFHCIGYIYREKSTFFNHEEFCLFGIKVERCRLRAGLIAIQVLKCMDSTLHIVSYY